MSTLCIAGDYPTEQAQTLLQTASEIAANLGRRIAGALSKAVEEDELSAPFHTLYDTFREAHYSAINQEFSKVMASAEATKKSLEKIEMLQAAGGVILALLPALQRAGAKVDPCAEDRLIYFVRNLEHHALALEGNLADLAEAKGV